MIIVYILKKWNVQRRNDIEDANIETIWLEVSFPKTKTLLLYYIYHPPNAHVSWFHYFNTELERATTFNHDIILTGDFNIDILSSHKSYAAERLNDMMQLNNLTERSIPVLLIFPIHLLIICMLITSVIYKKLRYQG